MANNKMRDGEEENAKNQNAKSSTRKEQHARWPSHWRTLTQPAPASPADPEGAGLARTGQLTLRAQPGEDQLTLWVQGWSGRPADPVGAGLVRAGQDGASSRPWLRAAAAAEKP